MNLNRFLLFLISFKGIGDTAIRKLINDGCIANIAFEKMEDILYWLKDHKIYFKSKKFVDELTLNDIDEANKKRRILEAALNENQCGYITYYSDNYPESFKSIEDYPIVLFYKGDINLLNSDKLCSIIGTRNPSDTAKKIGIEVSKKMTQKGYVVVSGLAEGCDTLGHRGCLDANGKTVAIVGTGLDTVFPKSNIDLQQEILNKGGLVISEYPIGFKGASFSFVQRDRLQAACAECVIVIQTSVNGGTMHASKACVEKYNKQLFVVSPSLLMDGDASGNQYLIDNYGAKVINNIDEL